MTDIDFQHETIEAFGALQDEYPQWTLSASSVREDPVWCAQRRGVAGGGTVTSTQAELRAWLAGQALAELQQAWPRWHVYHLETGWYARRGISAWITRDQMEQGVAYQLRARTSAELGDLLVWQDGLGAPAELA